MPQVQALATLHRSAESMWRELGSLQDIARWHPMVAAVHGEGQEPGATWTIETRAGQCQVVRLVEVDHEHHVYRYEMTSTGLPIADYVGELRIRADAAGKCTVCWTARFNVTSGDEKAAGDTVREFFRAGARPSKSGTLAGP
ncbi:MAG: SRPBCC family protein [Mycobacterium sp.]